MLRNHRSVKLLSYSAHKPLSPLSPLSDYWWWWMAFTRATWHENSVCDTFIAHYPGHRTQPLSWPGPVCPLGLSPGVNIFQNRVSRRGIMGHCADWSGLEQPGPDIREKLQGLISILAHRDMMWTQWWQRNKSFLSLFLCQVSPSLDNFDTVDRIQKNPDWDVCFRNKIGRNRNRK